MASGDKYNFLSSFLIILIIGYGYGGGPSRCYSFWQQFLACYISIKETNNKRVCIEEMEDYVECLHHTKEVLSYHYLIQFLI
ncbi:hypothetical protein PCK2_000090 [Pneumocystis canis]|nr:hypothetical protein PCK2_000090 [Pneumocystis canis]